MVIIMNHAYKECSSYIFNIQSATDRRRFVLAPKRRRSMLFSTLPSPPSSKIWRYVGPRIWPQVKPPISQPRIWRDRRWSSLPWSVSSRPCASPPPSRKSPPAAGYSSRQTTKRSSHRNPSTSNPRLLVGTSSRMALSCPLKDMDSTCTMGLSCSVLRLSVSSDNFFLSIVQAIWGTQFLSMMEGGKNGGRRNDLWLVTSFDLEYPGTEKVLAFYLYVQRLMSSNHSVFYREFL